ncbi:MAG: YggS family pyridoxal phosphate-dependent enzyme [Candidatus Omnitrophica bacterium]|nr:YggS family pyridoxal phosphate-dependent enzyme [Candidatus Omnitrophota bacterium]MDD5774753.1 YggS family pyridoxal phosphate-dependent enzyme [Candidatus Omnitrophota bacterium]
MISDNVRNVKARIEAACVRVRRDPAGVTLVAVTKGRPAGDIFQALDAGISDIGENKVQEASAKYEAVSGRLRQGSPVRWHMIGHLQTNKVKDAVRMFDLIHSVDSLRLAQEIDTQAAKIGKVQDILVEVKTSPEATKYGIDPDALSGLVEKIARLKNVRLQGLMTMAPAGAAAESARPYFRAMRSFGYAVLSMGMTDDFEVAVEEGATIVRIGRALFEDT